MAGISFFGPAAEAPVLHETDVMSMPTMDPPAPEQFMAWALSGGHNSRVQFRDGGETGMSLVWTRFEAGYPCAQVFAPRGKDLVCFEPMTAPANALRTGAFPVAAPGRPYTAAFSIEVEA